MTVSRLSCSCALQVGPKVVCFDIAGRSMDAIMAVAPVDRRGDEGTGEHRKSVPVLRHREVIKMIKSSVAAASRTCMHAIDGRRSRGTKALPVVIGSRVDADVDFRWSRGSVPFNSIVCVMSCKQEAAESASCAP